MGNVTSNTWSAVTPVSGTDYVYGTAFGFAVSSSGAAVLSWTVAAPPNVQALEVRAISRPSALASWTLPQTISAGFLPNGAPIDSAAVNASQNGVVVFDAVDAAGVVRSILPPHFRKRGQAHAIESHLVGRRAMLGCGPAGSRTGE